MTDNEADVLVLGAGVIGLTTAVCLAEAGMTVTLAAAEPPAGTTSATAGAIWGPHLVGMDDRIGRWATETLDRWTELTHPDLGANELDGIIHDVHGISATRKAGAAPPEFAAATAELVPCPDAEVPAGYGTAWRMTATIVSMPGYLHYLERRFGRAGGATSFPAKIARLAEARALAPAARVIVNCTGTGARELVPDADVVPVRGQTVVVANPGITEFFVGTNPADPNDLTHLFPHGDVLVLGGTEVAGDWSREPDPATAERILADCTQLEPALRGATVLEHRVGLRPSRRRVRLEAEARDGVTVVHNYGHGGSGVTLSWGCAEDAAALVLAALG